ncbi:hypothetical protein E4K72_18290 [Oxalobacteraceae bacterium OM1]|nr:hypothetical protein E4K72_18290 [Oxalobacteraceae bacterium OM1]
MDLMLIELVLWGGLLFFIWALKDGLGKVESDIEELGVLPKRQDRAARRRKEFFQPEWTSEPIGRYLGSDIFRFVMVNGRHYEFSRVCPQGNEAEVESDEVLVVPGLVYEECAAPASLSVSR